MDLNKDCKSDIILGSVDKSGNRFLEFYYYFNGKFGFMKSVSIPVDYSIGTFKNINQVNSPDLLFFDNSDKKLKIFLSNFDEQFPDGKKSYCLVTF